MTTLLHSRYNSLVTRLHDYAPEYRKLLIWLAVLVLAFNAGCAAVQSGAPSYVEPLPGQVLTVRFSDVLRELRFATLGSIQSIIMRNSTNGNILFAWPAPGGWGWVCLNGASANVCNAIREIGSRGNLANVKDFRILMDGAERLGYQRITAIDLKTLAPGLVQSILQSTTAFAQNVIPNIVILPAVIFENVPESPATWQQ